MSSESVTGLCLLDGAVGLGCLNPEDCLLNKLLLILPVTPETDGETQVRKPGFRSCLCHHCVGQVTSPSPAPASPLSYVDCTKPRLP